MANATLVGRDIEDGARIVSILEDAGILLKVALWMATPEYEEGRIVLASPSLDQTHPLRAYDKVALTLHGKFTQMEPSLLVLRMKDPFIQELRRRFAKAQSVEGMRLGGQTIGNRFVLEGHVYLIR